MVIIEDGSIMLDELNYNPSELMVVNAARLLRDGDVVFVGVGIPNLACNLAMRTHAPNLQMIYEAGVIGAQPSRLPLSIGDPTLVSGALSVCSMYDIFTLYLQRGNVDVGFLGGAQIDQFGNINATVIGDYQTPKCACLVQAAQWKSLPGRTAVTSSPRIRNGVSLQGWIFAHRSGSCRVGTPAKRLACEARGLRRSSPTWA
jgi:acyl CoA:acetate/3-ketoacid CoA transferase beta subunit